jgi:myo-inositol-1(or 4)-monophosphatase
MMAMRIDEGAALEFLLECARGAGRIVMGYASGVPEIRDKGRLDLVTRADLESEQYLIDTIMERFPEHAVHGEERGPVQQAAYNWYVDPLDGTINYAHGIPVFNVAVALAEGDRTLLGAVYDPTRDEMYWARRGGGAFLKGARLHVSEIKSLDHAVLGFSTHPFKLDAVRSRYQAILDRIGPRTQHLVNLGSQALLVAYVAAGRLDGMLAIPVDPWSSPAARLLVLEAGGTAEPAPGGPWPHPSGTLLVTNGHVRDELVGLMAPVDD